MPRAARSLVTEARPTLEELLVSGGDGRLALDLASGVNMYGCTPRPRRDGDGLSSSTASTISEYSYRRAKESWDRLSLCNGPACFNDFVEEARAELKGYLGIHEIEAEVVFSPSGTDSQLLSLFLVRAMLGTPLVSVIVGADQTGSGTAYTAKGLHFADREILRKGHAVEGLADGISSIAIPFCDYEGNPRTLADLDHDITSVVDAAVADGAHVLLQTMASSKLGWGAPSDDCIEQLTRRWPDKVSIVVDACQMRIGATRIQNYVACGYIVLITGSKFFCGPPFSGALLIPACLCDAIAAISEVSRGLRDYSRRFDWPSCWPELRDAFPAAANIGQWLRWEAALAEMRDYHAVPATFRASVLRRFAQTQPLWKGLKALPPRIYFS